MELAVHGIAVLIDQFEGVAAVAVHVAVAIRDTTVTEEEGDLGTVQEGGGGRRDDDEMKNGGRDRE